MRHENLLDLDATFVRPSTYVVGGFTKRVFDVVFSAAAIITFGAMMLVIAALLKLRSGGPVLFRHERIGLDGKPFSCVKFRTMAIDADERLKQILETDPVAAAEYAASFKLTNDPRIVPGIGTFLRKTSLDELPQFFNVLFGQMSVVGPRPVTSKEFFEFYGTSHPYTSARPGITGAWQTSGRNGVSFDERVRMDAKYVNDWSLLHDIQIVSRTVRVVCLDRDGS